MAIEFSLFKNSYSDEPEEHISDAEFEKRIREGYWSKPVLKLRVITDLTNYKKTKEGLPAVTISGKFKTRDKFKEVSKKLIKHSGLICLDIDAKDNDKMRVQDLIDKDCFMQYVSCSGKGIKIIYKCKLTKNPAEHRRIYDAAVSRLEKKKIKLKVDPAVKNIASLQYVSIDPNVFYFPKTKLVIHPLPPIKIKKTKPSGNQQKEFDQLTEYLDALGTIDVTREYDDWRMIGMGISYSLGEAGRTIFHKISKNYKSYSKIEVDEKYDGFLEKDPASIDRPTTLASVYQIINSYLPKATLKHLVKKYNISHAAEAGIGEEVTQGDLSGMVRYKLFLFKKVIDKTTQKLSDLVPAEINLNEFERLLRMKGFFRYIDEGKDIFVYIKDNIVEKVDKNDIIRIITRQVENEGDYLFTYQRLEFNFSWEEVSHWWRKIRGNSTIYNQVASSLEHWKPNLLKDNPTESFFAYRNGVVKVTKKGPQVIPYDQIDKQIWKDRILPRDFIYTKKVGMFELFFRNVAGRGKVKRENAEEFKRALWYYGYMLQGTKDPATARAWILYDVNAGNNGRTGKSIIGDSLGHIRFVTVIDGKQVDFRNRFWLQTVKPWTDIIFIDDPSKYFSLNPMFNMITGSVQADRKQIDPLEIRPKFLIASNTILESEGTSESDRQFVTQLDDFYVRYGKQQGNTITPLVKFHGKRFFMQWDDDDWSEFDSFAVRALMYCLTSEPPKNTIIGNSKSIRFKQLHGDELLFELQRTVLQHFDKGQNIIVISLLTQIIKDNGEPNLSVVKASKTARSFLDAIGAGKITIVQKNMGGGRMMTAYKTENSFEKFNLE